MTAIQSLRSIPARRVVAIPVKDEARHILPCLQAFAAQPDPSGFEVLLLLNDCTDATPLIVQAAAPGLPYLLHVHECSLPPDRASAGLARKVAMEYAAVRAGPRGVLLTTDADSRVAPDWVQTNLDALDAGADAVAGRAEIDPADAASLPRDMMAVEERVQTLTALLDEIAYRLDPDLDDPWPRHVQHSGASIAVTTEMFDRAGGIPDVPVGEDRAFFRALQRVDARIRHCPEAWVLVSGRIYGRAKGGMADTMRRRLERPDTWLDDCLEPAADVARRARLRSLARAYWNGHCNDVGDLARCLGLGVATVRECLEASAFGAAWQDLQDRSAVLQRRLIPAEALEAEIRNASDVLSALRSLRLGSRARSGQTSFANVG